MAVKRVLSDLTVRCCSFALLQKMTNHYFEFGIKVLDKWETVYICATSSQNAIDCANRTFTEESPFYRQAVPENCLQNGVDIVFAAPYENYLLIQNCKTGEEEYREIGNKDILDLEQLIEMWVDQKFDGEMEIDPPLIDFHEGDYWAAIKTNWASPVSVISWESAGFYLKPCK